jgi:hypothetical protein
MSDDLLFYKIASIEPRIRQLFEEACKVRPRDEFHADNLWYRKFKPRLEELVGWGAEKEELASPEAYETTYRTIYDALSEANK